MSGHLSFRIPFSTADHPSITAPPVAGPFLAHHPRRGTCQVPQRVGTWQVPLLVVSSRMANHGPFFRSGVPGGPGAQVSILPLSGRASGSYKVIEASLLDAGETATELELLRTAASGLGVVWGQDELGAWAVVPNEPAPPSPPHRHLRSNSPMPSTAKTTTALVSSSPAMPPRPKPRPKPLNSREAGTSRGIWLRWTAD